jgi:hypothetical protein
MATKAPIKATFSPDAGLLSVSGDDADNVIVTSRDAAGQILVNGGAVQVTGGTPTVANTSVIEIFGTGGNDTISLDEANGALPAAHLFGGAGNDVLTGGSGTTCSSAARATTSSTAKAAMTCCSAAPATTC